MRRVVPYILVGLGFFLLFLGPFMRLYALPRVEKVPLDTYSKDVAVGSGSYFNLHLLRVVGPVPLRNIGVTNGDVRAGSTSVVVLDRSFITPDMSMNGVTIHA